MGPVLEVAAFLYSSLFFLIQIFPLLFPVLQSGLSFSFFLSLLVALSCPFYVASHPEEGIWLMRGAKRDPKFTIVDSNASFSVAVLYPLKAYSTHLSVPAHCCITA